MRLKLFSLTEGAAFAHRVAVQLREPLVPHEERSFEDGEHKLRPLDDVEGADVYLIQSLHSGADSSVHDKLVKLLFFIATLRDAGATRVTAVIPYLCYGRKDRRTKARDPLSSRYLADLFQAVGTDCVITLDAHNLAAFENAFRCRTLHLQARSFFVDFTASQLASIQAPLVVASPDIGGVKRAEAFRLALAERLRRPLGHAFVEKYRSNGQLTGGTLVGEVQGATVLIVDDLIAGGGTMIRAAEALGQAGASEVYAFASHGQFCDNALARLSALPLRGLVVTNSLPQSTQTSSLTVIDCAPLIAEAIGRLHRGGPAAELSP
ncbi:ribose-phosphate diphosphokinase [Microbulbifer sp. 2201CG32-9]|uniref:ribose-phosphate diphosphokinase n=1 Tax=Microbulbifer sp. 2201CG32-9 TaxID=3232309 RepID=UPI00345BCEBA